MRVEEKMEAMFALQERLNDETNGQAWRDGVTKNGKRINWRRCIVMEVAELIDSLPWKHWKNIEGDLDLENIRIEVVDIWHFVMSELLRLESLQKATERSLLCRGGASTPLPERWRREDDRRLEAYVAPFERLMGLALEPHEDEAWRNAMVSQFWACMDASGMRFGELYRLYIGKNALNRFRQLHGYKTGTYRKIWNGREDNAVMQEILADEPDIDFDALMSRLARRYAEVG